MSTTRNAIILPGLAAAVTALAVAAAAAAVVALYEPPSAVVVLLRLVTISALYLVAAAVHELGHMLAGLLVGHRPMLFAVGPLRWQREGRRMVLRQNRSVAFIPGITASDAIGAHDLRRRTLVLLAGGPMLSLMFGVQCLALWTALAPLLLDGNAHALVRAAAVTLSGLGMMSLAVAVVTLLPFRLRGSSSDGLGILRLARNGDDARQETALRALIVRVREDVRPRDWPAEEVARASALRGGGYMEYAARCYAFLNALDCDDRPRARAELDSWLQATSYLPRSSHASAHLYAAIFAALYDGDATTARSHLALLTAGAAARQPALHALAEAAVLAAERDAAGAADVARNAVRLVNESGLRGLRPLHQDLAERIVARVSA